MAVDRLLRWGFAAAAIAWAAAIPVAAALAAAPRATVGEHAFAALAYAAGGVICHQQAGRSYHLWAVQLPVCARCTGIYAGAALGSATALAWPTGAALQRNPRAWLVAASVPIALTLVFEWTTGITPSNTIRALSGVPLGAAVAWLIVHAVNAIH